MRFTPMALLLSLALHQFILHEAAAVSLKAPIRDIAIATDGSRACAADSEGIKCWQPFSEPDVLRMVENPLRVILHPNGSVCASNTTSLQCRGATQFETSVKNLRDLDWIRIEDGFLTCWLDAEGARCHDENREFSLMAKSLPSTTKIQPYIDSGHFMAFRRSYNGYEYRYSIGDFGYHDYIRPLQKIAKRIETWPPKTRETWETWPMIEGFRLFSQSMKALLTDKNVVLHLVEDPENPNETPAIEVYVPLKGFKGLKNPLQIESDDDQVCINENGALICQPRRKKGIKYPKLRGLRKIVLKRFYSGYSCAIHDDGVAVTCWTSDAKGGLRVQSLPVDTEHLPQLDPIQAEAFLLEIQKMSTGPLSAYLAALKAYGHDLSHLDQVGIRLHYQLLRSAFSESDSRLATEQIVPAIDSFLRSSKSTRSAKSPQALRATIYHLIAVMRVANEMLAIGQKESQTVNSLLRDLAVHLSRGLDLDLVFSQEIGARLDQMKPLFESFASGPARVLATQFEQCTNLIKHHIEENR